MISHSAICKSSGKTRNKTAFNTSVVELLNANRSDTR